MPARLLRWGRARACCRPASRGSMGASSEATPWSIRTLGGTEIGRGLVAYSHTDAAAIIGRKSGEIADKLGYLGRPELIHRDDMSLRKKSS